MAVTVTPAMVDMAAIPALVREWVIVNFERREMPWNEKRFRVVGSDVVIRMITDMPLRMFAKDKINR